MKFWKHALAALLAVCGILAALPETAYAAPDQIEEALAWAVEIAEDDSHGYDKDNRCGPDYDCSSFVSYALIAAGFELDGPVSTCTMKDALVGLGFKAYRRGEVKPRRGDILLDPWRHAEFYLGKDRCVAAHDDYDYRSGDRTGKEINVREPSGCRFCRNREYTWILRWTEPEPEPEPEPAPAFGPNSGFKPLPGSGVQLPRFFLAS